MPRARAILCVSLSLACTGCAMMGRVLPASPLEQQSHKVLKAECTNFTRVATEQRDPMWCWAACAEMVHRYFGRTITQEDIVKQVQADSGSSDAAMSEGATNRQMLLSLDPTYKQQRERYEQTQAQTRAGFRFDAEKYLSSQIQPYAVNTDAAIDSLRQREPLIAALREDRNSSLGHAYVLYAAKYIQRDADARRDVNRKVGAFFKDAADAIPYRYGLVSVDLIDPYTGKSVTMDAESFGQRLDFMISRQSAQRALADEYQSIRIP